MRCILVLVTVSAIFPSAPLPAQDSLTTTLHQCSAITASVERLACYDRLAGHPISAAPQPAPSPPAGNPVSDFGLDTIPQPKPMPAPRSPLDSITSQVTDFTFDVRGHFIVTLANGQIWREIEGDTVNIPLRKDRTHTATISRAVLGSYSIRFDNPRGLFKVLRVR